MTLVKLLNDINQKFKSTKNANIIIGASMGGLISKYALSYMEKNGMDHETNIHVSLDSPHNGANITLGLQHAINYFVKYSDGAKIIRNVILNSIAAKQMLIHHYKGGNRTLRKTFLEEFALLGLPKKCKNIAISNGNPSGIGLNYSPGELIFGFDGDVKIFADLHAKVWSLPDQSSGEFTIGEFDGPFNGEAKITVSGKIYPYDSAPGGWRNTLQYMERIMIKEKPGSVRKFKFYKNANYHCFIPTISSLAMTNVSHPYYNVKNEPGDIYSKTAFDQIYYPSQKFLNDEINKNQKHVKITTETTDWLASEINRTNIILDGNTWNYGEYKATQSITLKPGFSSKNIHLSIGKSLDCE